MNKKPENFAVHRANGETFIRLDRPDGSTYAWTVIDTADWELVRKRRWRAVKDGRVIYARNGSHGTTTALHRLVAGKPGLEVDHKDRNGLNNRRSNLRDCTTSQNQANQDLSKANTSGYRGVSWKAADKRWRAMIRHQGQRYHIGMFKEKEEAARAYDRKAIELHGEFAYLNFPDEH